jgi:membrane fusion protein (multidrug efflux system)
MQGPNDLHPATAEEVRRASAEAVSFDASKGELSDRRAENVNSSTPPGPADHPVLLDRPSASAASPSAGAAPDQTPAEPSSRHRSRWLSLALAAVCLGGGGYIAIPWVVTAFNTVSTDDAYVNGHVSFVAPRVAGQVTRVLVDDNYRVKKGQVLVEIDPEPYRVQVAIKKSAVKAAQTDLAAAQAEVRGQVAQARAYRFKLEHAIEDVDNQIAVLRAAVAILSSRRAALNLAQANLKRGQQLLPQAAISREDVDLRRETSKVAEANVEQARQTVYSIRVGLGLPAQPLPGQDLADVPPDLDQNFSAVREALGDLLHSVAAFGYFPTSWTATPKEVIAAFHEQDPTGNLNRIFAHLIPMAPAIEQAEAKLQQAQCDLDQAELNLRYCTIVSEIDGVVTGRNVNPGNNVQVGQSLMAVRSITEIWIDANFKETQLADLRIGQPVRCDVDMYGKRREFEGRITGFTMGTGQTLALLPPENATGNFVKIVQRLPVRIELTNYNPDQAPLFVGLSVVPYVYYKKPPNGPHAGDVLQPLASLPEAPTEPKP